MTKKKKIVIICKKINIISIQMLFPIQKKKKIDVYITRKILAIKRMKFLFLFYFLDEAYLNENDLFFYMEHVDVHLIHPMVRFEKYLNTHHFCFHDDNVKHLFFLIIPIVGKKKKMIYDIFMLMIK